MTTIKELYPHINLEHFAYETERSFMGYCDRIYYLVNKSDEAVIVMDTKKDPAYVLVFIFEQETLVNTFRHKNLFMTHSAQDDVEGERNQGLTTLMESYYSNDCFIHLGSAINDQVNQFMKSVNCFKVKLHFLHEYGKQVLDFIEIEDRVYDYVYKAIVRDGLVYFTMMFNDDPEKEEFVNNKFSLNVYNHYEAAGGYVIDVFMGDYFRVTAHYDFYEEQYTVDIVRYDEDSKVKKYREILKNHEEYDVNFIYNFVYEAVVLHYPKYTFVKELVEMSIISEDEKLTPEHMKIYDMAVI